MPASITMAYPIEQGTVKKEVVPVLKTVKSLSLNDLKYFYGRGIRRRCS